MRKNVGGIERIARVLVGATLLYVAVSRWRGRLRGKLALAAGVNLLSTGLSQRCPANAAIGRDTTREGEVVHYSDLPA